MRKFKSNALFVVLAALVGLTMPSAPTTAAFQGMPKALPYQSAPELPIVRPHLDRPILPPFAHSLFCLRRPAECEVKRLAMRHGRIALNDARRAEMVAVNRTVNRSINPQHKSDNVIEANWTISPSSGDCNDYAVTKRHLLIKLGWPTDALLLAEVVTGWGEHHLVLVINAREGTYVLDNLTPAIREWTEVSYRWVRMQSPKNPKLWWTVRPATA